MAQFSFLKQNAGRVKGLLQHTDQELFRMVSTTEDKELALLFIISPDISRLSYRSLGLAEWAKIFHPELAQFTPSQRNPILEIGDHPGLELLDQVPGLLQAADTTARASNISLYASLRRASRRADSTHLNEWLSATLRSAEANIGLYFSSIETKGIETDPVTIYGHLKMGLNYYVLVADVAASYERPDIAAIAVLRRSEVLFALRKE